MIIRQEALDSPLLADAMALLAAAKTLRGDGLGDESTRRMDEMIARIEHEIAMYSWANTVFSVLIPSPAP